MIVIYQAVHRASRHGNHGVGACAVAYISVEAEHRMQAGTRARRGTTKPWHSFVSDGKQISLAGSSASCKRDLGYITLE